MTLFSQHPVFKPIVVYYTVVTDSGQTSDFFFSLSVHTPQQAYVYKPRTRDLSIYSEMYPRGLVPMPLHHAQPSKYKMQNLLNAAVT